MPTPLLQAMPESERKYASNLSLEVCERIAKLAKLQDEYRAHRTKPYNSNKKPGEQLLSLLHRRGCTIQEYLCYMNSVNKLAHCSPQPEVAIINSVNKSTYSLQSKVAVLIANDKYEHLSNLGTPSSDCDSLGQILRKLDFITVTVHNTKSSVLKDILVKTFGLIPENSYCMLFYAGHGCELVNTKCILGTDCPSANIYFDQCITENWLLRESAKFKPELCILIMDMCRNTLDRDKHPQLYAAISNVEEYSLHGDLLISYSTQSSCAAYECVNILCEETVGMTTRSLATADVVDGGSSLYAYALCNRLTECVNENVDISTMLDKVHKDFYTTMVIYMDVDESKEDYRLCIEECRWPWTETHFIKLQCRAIVLQQFLGLDLYNILQLLYCYLLLIFSKVF